jgi:hypothetical protein
MLDPCLHLYCNECIKSWSKKINECPKCKETIKGTNKQPEVERLLKFYSKLCQQERDKLEKIKALVDEREEIQTRINSILDQQTDVKPVRPTTAQPRRTEEIGGIGKSIYSVSEVNKEEEEGDSYYCKICKRKPLHMKLKDYQITEMSPFSLNGNGHQQNLLSAFLTNTGMNCDTIYKQIISLLPTIDPKEILPDCKASKLKENNSACDE